MKPPDCLTAPELESEAAGLLRAYYGPRLDGGRPFDGRYFDTWRPGPPDTFTAEDILSMAFLGVTINRRAFLTILAPSPDNRFNALLAKVPDRVDFWDAGAPAASSAQWQLYDMLRGLSGIGPTKASKLLARKRRHLIPIRDSVVARVLDLRKPFWAPLYGASRRSTCAPDWLPSRRAPVPRAWRYPTTSPSCASLTSSCGCRASQARPAFRVEQGDWTGRIPLSPKSIER